MTIWFPFPEHREEMTCNCIRKDFGWKIRKDFQMLKVIKSKLLRGYSFTSWKWFRERQLASAQAVLGGV